MNYDYKMLAIDEFSFSKFVEMEAAFEARLATVEARDRMDDEEVEKSRLLTMHEDIAIINIKGMLVNTDSYYNRYFGRISYNEVREAVIQAVEFGARAILFDVDSPGGNVNGLHDTANLISNIGIPTVSFASGNMASAAYFLGSQADTVLASDFSEVGSIGVIIKLYDRSKMLKDVGVTPMRFRSGKLKAVGDPDFKLDKEEKDYIQGKVALLASKFTDIVSDARGMPVSVMETYGITSGRTFVGGEAQKVNLIDGVKTFDESVLKTFNLAKNVDNHAKNGLSLR